MHARLAAAILILATECGCAPSTSPIPLAELNYRADGHLIMAQVAIGGRPAVFMLDSGASHSVIDPRLVSELGLHVERPGRVTGTGQGDVSIAHASPLTLQVGALPLAVEDPWIIDLSGVPINPAVRGLIGAELFKTYVVRLDPDRRTLQIFDPNRFVAPPGAAWIPLIVEGDKLFVDAILDVRPGTRVQARLRVDTGSEEFVNDASVRHSREIRSTVLGNGLGANYQGISGVFDGVRIGPFRFQHAWGPGGERSSVGMEMFRRFVVTFDAPHARMYLQPASGFDDPVPPPA